MRARFVDVPSMARRYGWKEAIVGWWEDWPPRTKAFWSVLLFEPGQGWLRWKEDRGFTIVGFDPGEPEDYFFVPPLHRAWYQVKAVFFVPKAMLIGTGKPRYRWSWEEARPCTGGSLWTNPDRYRDLWGGDWKTKRIRARRRRERAAA